MCDINKTNNIYYIYLGSIEEDSPISTQHHLPRRYYLKRNLL